jgi:TPR repeat protein
VLVIELVRAGAAEAAGMRVGDIVQRVDGRDTPANEDLLTVVQGLAAGTDVDVELRRAGEGADDLKRLLEARSDAGNTGAAVGLARLRYLGHIFGKDQRDAARLYLKAAEGGDVQAMNTYALLAKDGIGIERNDQEAARWFLKAAEAGNEAAMTNLGGLYEAGRGATKDAAEAARWYRRAVDGGNVFAMHRLALLYEAGRGVKKDDIETVRLLRPAGGLRQGPQRGDDQARRQVRARARRQQGYGGGKTPE